jgi:hypothetical protein
LLLRIEASDNDGREKASMTLVWIAALSAALLLGLSVPSLRLLARHARQRSLQARIRRRLGARVGSVTTRPLRPLLPDRVRS